MTREEVAGTVGNMLDRWGFPVLVALAAGWVLRNDVLLPLVEEHRAFVQQLSETQREIGQTQQDICRAINEQTRLLTALQPRQEKVVTTKATPE